VQGDVSIPNAAYLHINAGAEVRFASTDSQMGGVDNSRVEVTVKSGGTLEINGTAAASVTLLADGAANPLVWVGIVVESGATSVDLHHMVLQHSSSGVWNSAAAGVVVLDGVTLAGNALDLTQIGGAGNPAISGTLAAGRFSGNLVIPSGATLDLNRTNGLVQSGTFALSSGATYRPALSDVSSYEQLQVSGTSVTLAGALDLDVASLTASTGQSFRLIDKLGALAVSGSSRGSARALSSTRAAIASRSRTWAAPGTTSW